MEIIINIFSEIFGILFYRTVFEIPLFVWLIFPAVISFVFKFIQGKK